MGFRDNKDRVQKVLEQAQAKGCTVTLKNSGHYSITTPSGTKVFCSQTPSDYRGVKRTVSLLRRYGVEVDA